MFLGFYVSYAIMQLGLAHDWYKIAEDQVAMTVAMFLICWILVIVMLIAETLELPAAFAVLVCAENLIRVDDVMESPKLAE